MSVGKHIRQLGGETVVYGLSGAIARFISIFLVPLYTRVFSPEDYGQIAILSSFVGLMSAIIVLGLDSASGRWYYDTTDTALRMRVMSSWFWSNLIFGSSACLLIILLARPLSGLMLGTTGSALLVIAATLTIPFTTFRNVAGNWMRYQRKAWLTTIFNTLTSLATIALVVVFVLLLRRGVAGLFIAQIVAGLLTGIAAVLILKSWILPRYVSRPVLREMLVYGLPLVPAALASWVTASADRFILKGYVSTAEIGIYAIAASLASGVALITTGFQYAWGPFAFSILHEPEAGRVYSKVLSVYSLAGCFIATAVSLFAPQLLYLLTTPKYYAAASSVSWLAFGNLAIGAIYIVAIGANAAKKSTPVAASIFIGAAVNTAINFAIIPFMGRDGAAFSTFAAYAVVTAFLYVASQKLYPIPYQVRDVLICLGFSWALIGLDHFFVPTWGLAAIAVRMLMCLAFLPLAFWIGVLKPAYVRWLFDYASQRIRNATA
jgi:O-antigen/teichoic acid export membrane protein